MAMHGEGPLTRLLGELAMTEAEEKQFAEGLRKDPESARGLMEFTVEILVYNFCA
jgi:hypothetical protein